MLDGLVIRNARLKDSKNVLPIWDEFIAYHKRITTMDFEKGMPHIILLVAVENAAAIKCYEKDGYSTTILMQKKPL